MKLPWRMRYYLIQVIYAWLAVNAQAGRRAIDQLHR